MGFWIQGATEGAHGQFREKARKAGMSTMEYASHVLAKSSKATTKTKRQASLAKTLSGFHKGK